MNPNSSTVILRILAAIVGLLCVVTLVHFAPAMNAASFVYYGERIQLMMKPTAPRAYAFAMNHFNSRNPQAHNMDRAEYFLRRTIAADPAYPYAHQQLARILFLRGELEEAITQINTEITLQGDKDPSAFYIRGLIEGFQGNFSAAANDYSHFLTLKPDEWPGINDYAWVLIKSYKFTDAAALLRSGVAKYPDNPWLLNSYATALFDLGNTQAAAEYATKAQAAVMKLTTQEWIKANPGNDPGIASDGLKAFQNATAANLKKILETPIATSSVKSIR